MEEGAGYVAKTFWGAGVNSVNTSLFFYPIRWYVSHT